MRSLFKRAIYNTIMSNTGGALDMKGRMKVPTLYKDLFPNTKSRHEFRFRHNEYKNGEKIELLVSYTT